MTPPAGAATPDPGQGSVARLRPGGRAQQLAGPLPRRNLRTRPTGAQAAPGPSDPADRPGGIREWHTLTDDERQAAWTDLVDWVTWLHDRYELSVEERLPHCWPHHPGLIEELHALKVWRHEIYNATTGGSGGGSSLGTGGPVGQAARYWHAELRQVIHAATTQYAAGCRAGHRDATPLPANGIRDQWLSRDPLTGVPTRLRQPRTTGHRSPADPGTRADAERSPTDPGAAPDAARARPRVMTGEQLRAAVRAGTATTLGELIADVIHHDGTWWTPEPGSGRWRSVTDPTLLAELDTAAARMRAADHASAHQTKPRPH